MAEFTHPDNKKQPQKMIVQKQEEDRERPSAPTNTLNDAAQLQRAIGNQAIGRLRIQRKMTLGPVGDSYEQEADTVAKQVVTQIGANPQPTGQRQEEEELQMKPLAQRQEEEELQMKPLPAISAMQRQEEEELQMKPLAQRQEEEELQMKPLAQRQEEEELQMKPLQREEEEELQMKPLAQRQEEEELQAKHDPMVDGGELDDGIETAVQSARVGGQPMPDNVRAPMENAFGADFSGVKIHTGGQADTLNRSLQARAFTTGQDVFFRQGEYNPDNSSGQELLAHELTHVVQQGGGGAG
ncbi:MAG: DUF4157 domain-containing protein [Anaerolinea sp.]|nr:DUF4157 domain-containing protein [Anaerolinea sp.]